MDSSTPSSRQLWVLLGAAAHELFWALPVVAGELRGWRERALAIPDGPLRDDALDSIGRKRGNTDGVVLFSILAHRRDPHLLRLLVAYETIWDFLDCVSERGAAVGEINGLQLHLALLEAVDLERSITPDYYRYHPYKQDAGYLQGLVEVCREACAKLPSYWLVRELLVEQARRSEIAAYNHQPDPVQRDRGLESWAQREFPGQTDPAWFELTAAASCSAAVHLLLVLAADPNCSERQIDALHDAYFPWFSVATTMLDSYVDREEDIAGGAHIYIDHYPTSELALERVGLALRNFTRSIDGRADGPRHAVIMASMVAMYLSKDSVRTPAMRVSSRSLAEAGGPLVRLLLPVLRLWRIAYGQRSA